MRKIFNKHFLEAGHFRGFISVLQRFHHAIGIEEAVEILKANNHILHVHEAELFDICDMLATVEEAAS